MEYFTLHNVINEQEIKFTHCTLDICKHKCHNKVGHVQGYSVTCVAHR